MSSRRKSGAILVLPAFGLAALLTVAGCISTPEPAAVAPVSSEAGTTESPQRAAWHKWLRAMQACMDDKGWKLALLPEDEGPGFVGNDPNITLEQFQLKLAAYRECEGLVGPQPFSEMTEDLARKQYAEVVERARCLTAEGFDIQEPPSESKYVAQLLAQDPKDIPWDPYDDVPGDPVSWGKATSACPQGGLWGFE